MAAGLLYKISLHSSSDVSMAAGRKVIMTSGNSSVDPGVILDLLEAFRRSKTMFAAVSLGIFDTLESAPKSLDRLADPAPRPRRA